MAYVITALCSRDGACAEVCPVECIVKGPEGERSGGWPISSTPMIALNAVPARLNAHPTRSFPRRSA